MQIDVAANSDLRWLQLADAFFAVNKLVSKLGAIIAGQGACIDVRG